MSSARRNRTASLPRISPSSAMSASSPMCSGRAGWWDVDVTEKGAEEARVAGELMAAKGLDFDMCFTSLQTRAIKTLDLALEAMGRLWLPVEKDWRLNERHYGGLTGLNKAETAAKHGDEQVHIWRRSFDIPPPPLEAGSEYDLSQDRRYAGINIPSTDSLKATIAPEPRD